MNDETMLEEHQQIYHGFVRLITIATGAVVIALALMALFLL